MAVASPLVHRPMVLRSHAVPSGATELASGAGPWISCPMAGSQAVSACWSHVKAMAVSAADKIRFAISGLARELLKHDHLHT